MNSGSWSAVTPWPIIAIHAILTPDAKVLTFGTDQTGQQGSHMLYDLYDPATGLHTTLNYVQNTDIFCSCCVIDPITDQILIAGGDARPEGNVNGGVPFVHTFDYHTDQLSLNPAATLNYSRWYATTLTLADGRVLLLGGIDGNHNGVGTPEIYTHGVGWQTLPGAASTDIATNWFYPRAWVSSSGAIFGFSTGGDNAGTLFSINIGGQGRGHQSGAHAVRIAKLRSSSDVRAGQDPHDRQKWHRLDYGYQRGDADLHADWQRRLEPCLVKPYRSRRRHRPVDGW